MTHRQVLEALSGLLMGMFVAILAGTVVSTSLPRIIADLHGDQASYTWVVTATLLATTVSTPIWGKFSDLFNRKLLVQLALVLFVIGSALAGLSQDTGALIVFRVVQGLGAGGLTALVQVILSDIISPRERGRYMGFMGAVMAVGMAGGPLIGGLITDGIGWRWNFYVAIPFAVVALILIQRTLHLPKRPATKVRIDYLGLVLIAAGVSTLLIWITLVVFGDNPVTTGHFAFASATSFTMLGGALVLLVAAVLVELRVAEPIIPVRLFANRTFALVVVGSLAVGVAIFGTSVFLAQYMQLSRGLTPTVAGLATLPMILGLLLSSSVIGNVISRTGRWKRWMILGAVLLIAGLVLLATIDYTTPYWELFVFMAVMGAGLGMLMQNLVLVVQNSVDVRQIGAASASVAFFRSLGGTIGVSVLGAILGTRVANYITDGITHASPTDQASAIKQLGTSGQIPEVGSLTGFARTIIEDAYGHGVAEVFLIAVPLAVITLLAVVFLPRAELGTRTGIEQMGEKGHDAPVLTAVEAGAVDTVEVAADEIAGTPDHERLVGAADADRAPRS
ncbi:MDR family MFS transporter [Galbitalea sp. SE-J8]|nr:MDR family MFS transporter [Galbitalea sp. SE-J8]MDM4762773.1 MDR family MFS transporter [Galbitalea sp. SE-J8]